MFHKCVCCVFATVMLVIAVVGTGCGVDTVDEYFDPPKSDGHIVHWNTADRIQHYYSFYTTEVNSGSEVVFLGTDVYYKIYTNASSIDSITNSVSAQSENAQLSYLKGRGYKTLLLQGTTPFPLIKSTGSNRRVEIRLASYSLYERKVKIGSSEVGIPWRNSVNAGFQFGSGSGADVRPANGDTDCSVASSADTYYVDAYAVSIGRNTSDSTTYYSSVLHLGVIPISYPWTLN